MSEFGRKKAIDPALLEAPHPFWDTQPVPRMVDDVSTEGPMEEKTLDEVPKEPYALASVLEWVTPDVSDEAQLAEVYQLLCENYVEDDDSLFRFNYSPAFLKWATQPPGAFPEWLVGVRKKSDQKLLAFIAGVPCNVRMGEVSKQICEINFLCVHKSLRHRRLAPILIKEVTRRVNLRNIWQAVYTAGIQLPKAFASCQYFHRSLNPQKLVDMRFSRIPPIYEKFQRPMEAMKRNYQLPAKSLNLRAMVPEDLPQVHALLSTYLRQFRVAPAFDLEEAGHWLLPREGVLHSFVLENPASPGQITDFLSFYALNSTVIGHPKHKELRAAYCYYYVAGTVKLSALMQEALIMARDLEFDVFNALTLLDNTTFLTELKFGQGDGHLQYYFYNWRFPQVEPREVGLVML